MLDEGHLGLDARVGDLTHLVRVEAVPEAVVELGVEGGDGGGRDEVDEGVADLARVRVRVRNRVRVRVRVRVSLLPLTCCSWRLGGSGGRGRGSRA